MFDPNFVAEKKLVSSCEASIAGIVTYVDCAKAIVVLGESRFYLVLSEIVGVISGTSHSTADTPAKTTEQKIVLFWLESPMSMCY